MDAVDIAAAYTIPPSEFLGLGYEPWGETDRMLTLARAALRAAVCPCGCGQYADESQNPDFEKRWVVEDTLCYAAKAVADYRESNEVEGSAYVSVRFGTEDEAAESSFYDPARAAEVHRRHMAKFTKPEE